MADAKKDALKKALTGGSATLPPPGSARVRFLVKQLRKELGEKKFAKRFGSAEQPSRTRKVGSQ